MRRVSICIPCHNAAPFLREALDSVLVQDWSDLEILVVNDGSTDASASILREYNSEITVITARCGSAAKARNRAFKESNGELIKFFDADDVMSPNLISAQVVRLGDRNDAVAVSEWGRFYDNDLATYRANLQSVWRDMKACDWLVESWADARPMMQPGMFLIPRKIVETAGGWNEELTLIDDFEFFSRILCHSNDVLFTPGAALYYRSGVVGSLSGQKGCRAVTSAFESLLQGTKQLLGHRSDAAAQRSCANLLQDFIYTYYPNHRDLCEQMERRVQELGGADLSPDGPPRFQQLNKVIGWKAARRIQRLAEYWRGNSVFLL